MGFLSNLIPKDRFIRNMGWMGVGELGIRVSRRDARLEPTGTIDALALLNAVS